ncbi:ATP-binding protein [Vulcanisaeta sp. JCM 14467]|uniref:ATP-binding protein n=1 Tax=Vulcanisaeta sp. JCM 14467 TaxID=1295370 RepID=UPI0006D2ACC8|nr:ATP-binding protein [Vulcanisaeta sp. JCM 14467]
MNRVKLRFANLEVNFVDREQAIKWIEYWASRGMALPHVIYGPEGCGKSAWLRQGAELLRELGFDVIYVNPIESAFTVELGIEDLRNKLMNLIREATSQTTWGRVIWSIIDIARSLIEAGTRKLAIIVDDAFQVIGIDKAAIYVKGLLGILEHPPASYDKIIAIAATSEGVSLGEIGRHSWSDTAPIWNMSKEGFRQLYEQLPELKPDFEEIWRLTGGNPRMLERLYESGWMVDKVINDLVREKMITPNFTRKWSNHLREAIEDPDYLWYNAPEELTNELIEKNLIIYFLPERDQRFWVDQPPPEQDPELGIGKHVAWQTPIHREAIKRALKEEN